MEILEAKTQKLTIKSGQDKQYLLPVYESCSGKIEINLMLEDDARCELYVLGIFNKGNSDILIKTVNKGKGSSVKTVAGLVIFQDAQVNVEGLVKVEKGAIGSDSQLNIQSMILSESARISFVPSMEIEENDVTASHGAAIKNIEQEQVFYMRSRGVPLDLVNELLIKGFLKEISDKIPHEIQSEFDMIIEEQLDINSCLLNCEYCK